MNIFRLRLENQFVNPRWLNKWGHGAVARLPVNVGQVLLDGETLVVQGQRSSQAHTHLEATIIPDGTLVDVWCDGSGYFVCALGQERDQAKAERARVAQEAQRLRLEHRNTLREDALVFNASLNVPVRWVPGIKDVLSGLSESSSGDGTNARTVVHVQLEEPLVDGRIQRGAGDFLCTSASGSNGKRWSAQSQEPSARVTCKACLRLAARWQQKA